MVDFDIFMQVKMPYTDLMAWKGVILLKRHSGVFSALDERTLQSDAIRLFLFWANQKSETLTWPQ